jgi:hypothetical protein
MKAHYSVKLSDGSEDIISMNAKLVDGKLQVENGQWYLAWGSLFPDLVESDDGRMLTNSECQVLGWIPSCLTGRY